MGNSKEYKEVVRVVVFGNKRGKSFKKEVVHSRNTLDNLIKVRTKRTEGLGNRKVFDEFCRRNVKN